ncbi:MAG: DMT family transporter [Promethearchaeota archaeon]
MKQKFLFDLRLSTIVGPMSKSNWREYALLTLAMFFWGLSWPLTKMLVEYATSFQIGFIRFFIAGLTYFIILVLRYRKNFSKYTWKGFKKFAILALLGIFGYGILFLTAMHYTTSAQGAVIAGIQPAIIALMASFIHKERLAPRWRYFGILFSFSGVLVIIGVEPFLNYNQDHLIGNIIVVIAFLFFASYSVYGKKVMQEYNSFETTAWATIIGMSMFGISAVIENKWEVLQIQASFFWIAILILALLTTVISFFIYFWVIQRVGATKTGIFINLVPVFGTLASVVLLQEVLSWTLWVGLALISVGIGFINFPLNSSSLKSVIPNPESEPSLGQNNSENPEN